MRNQSNRVEQMNSGKDISVVIPVYEAAYFIKLTLQTIADQSLLPLEVVIVDDGSRDDTCKVVEDFCQKNPHLDVRLIREKHRGPGFARNVGIKAAKGRWVAFLDSDDLWHKNKIEKIISASKLAPEANFFCHNEIHRLADKQETILDYSVGYRNDLPLASQLFKRNLFSTSAVVCQKDRAIEVGGFDEALSSAQDYEFWFRMTPGLKVNFVREVLGVYVERPGNISSGKIWRRYSNLLKVLFRHRKLVTRKIFIGSVLRNSAAYIYYWIMSGKYIGGLWR